MRDPLIAAGLWDASDTRDPSESIEAAWQVVEKLISLGWNVYISNEGDPAEWVVQADFGIERMIDTIASTAPLAICQAALKAVA